MEERRIDEFESMFEAAVRPSVEIAPIAWSRLLVAPDGTERSSTAVALALHLALRLKVPVRFVVTRSLLEGEEKLEEGAVQPVLEQRLKAALARAEEAGVEASGVARVGAPGEVILAEVQAEPTSLLIIPAPHGGANTPGESSLGSTVDHLLRATDCPALIFKSPAKSPEDVLLRIVAYIPGGFGVGPHFSLPFSLVERGGSLDLLHVVNEEEVQRYASAFQITPDVETQKADSIVRSLEQRMTALLEEAVKNVKEEPFRCRSQVEVGLPLQRVALHLLNEKASLLVVDAESKPDTPIPAEAYALIKEISGVPILVL